MGNKIDLIGKRFDRLVVIEEAPSRKGSAMWICKCDCGNTTKPIRVYDLLSGKRKSCGCLNNQHFKEMITKHGLRHTRLYCIWCNMKSRCYDANRHEFNLYGGRGIKVCNEWKHDFKSFYDWSMENGYNPEAKRGECTLDRIDVNGDYCPENCRWAPQKEQCNNLRKNVLIEIEGTTKTLKQWADESGLDESKIRYRYNHGYTGKDLLKKERVRK